MSDLYIVSVQRSVFVMIYYAIYVLNEGKSASILVEAETVSKYTTCLFVTVLQFLGVSLAQYVI